jgi:YVTN family beta-propeller protein
MQIRLLLAGCCALALTAAQPDLAVLEKPGGAVGFYTVEGQHLATVKVGNFPHEGVLSPDGSRLYVTDNGVLWLTDEGEGGNTVSILDTRAMQRVGVIDLGRFRRPHGIALAPTPGQLLVTTELPPRLLLVDAVARRVLRDYEVQGKNPHMVTLGPDGEWAFVSNTESASVAAVHLKSGRMKLIPTAARPQGGVLSKDRKLLYITNTGAGRITVLDPKTQTVLREMPVGKGAGRIALTPDGGTLIYNLQEDQAVGFLDLAAGRQTATVPLTGPPLSLTMSRDGKYVFSGVQSQDKVFVISVAERKIVRTFETPKGAGPDPSIVLR